VTVTGVSKRRLLERNYHNSNHRLQPNMQRDKQKGNLNEVFIEKSQRAFPGMEEDSANSPIYVHVAYTHLSILERERE
jgi:hypothetical protein